MQRRHPNFVRWNLWYSCRILLQHFYFSIFTFNPFIHSGKINSPPFRWSDSTIACILKIHNNDSSLPTPHVLKSLNLGTRRGVFKTPDHLRFNRSQDLFANSHSYQAPLTRARNESTHLPPCCSAPTPPDITIVLRARGRRRHVPHLLSHVLHQDFCMSVPPPPSKQKLPHTVPQPNLSFPPNTTYKVTNAIRYGTPFSLFLLKSHLRGLQELNEWEYEKRIIPPFGW